MGVVDDNRGRGRVNEGGDKQEPQSEPEKEGPSGTMPGFRRLGNRPDQQGCQENHHDLFHFSLPAQPVRLAFAYLFPLLSPGGED